MEDIKEEKTIRSAFDSTTFDADISIHVEKDATDVGSATISPSGRDIAIASKTGLDIIDLDSPLNPPRQLRHGTSWNVADVQWSPFAARDYWIASTSNQKALVWNLTMPEDARNGAIEHTLHAHTRAITDINFSAHHADLLATCAVDGYVHCWDLRRPRRPVMTFVDWDAGATQVKWNRQDGHVLASSHDRWLRIWDARKGAYPLRSIEAHESKIYGIDWNRTRAEAIVTCSLDKSIKFWDYGNEEDVPERIIRTAFPVWRARHTPFGWGLLAMPQNAPGDLYLYDRRKEASSADDTSTPAVAVFNHGEKQVKEFLWRTRGGINEEGIDDREFQLVSWGDDKEVRLQPVQSKLLVGVGYVRGSQVHRKLNVTRKGAVYKTFRNIERSETEKKYVSIKGPRHWSGSHDSSPTALMDSSKRIFPAKKFRAKFGNYGSTMKGKGTETIRRNKINWMSGVKFSKSVTEGSNLNSQFRDRRLSLISPNFDNGGDWDAPESLHDEIIRVDRQYSKVTFTDVNMDKRAITLSMRGPWGEGGDMIFIKVDINFPDQYPSEKIPIFKLGRTSLISDAIYDKITEEVHQIAANFLRRRRGCLEAAICYLLGELDLAESTLWFVDGEDADDSNAIVDESSSEDEDDDIPAGTSAMMSQELDSSATEGMLVANLRHAEVPLPRLCGARFSNNGKLVCFFPPKEEKFKSLLGSVSIDKSRTKVQHSFNTFARLGNDSLPPRSKFSSLNNEDYDGETSDSSHDSETSSSSDSDSSQFQVSVAFDFWRRSHGPSYRKGLSTNRSHKSSDRGTGTGTGASRLKTPKPKNTVSIYNIDMYTPSKPELGEEYAVFGDGLDVCNHNASIATKYGYQDRADIWTYAGMLLQHEVPLEVLDQTHRKEPILVIARDMIRRCRNNSGSDSGIDVTYDSRAKPASMSGRVKWGHSPIAKYLIDDLFNHFETLADIQMLAMLSCVFSEPATVDEIPNAETRLSQPQTPLSMKTPAFSLDYFPSDAAAWSMYQKTPYSSISSTPKTALTPNPYPGSLGSSNGPWGSDHASTSYSTGETPPLKSAKGSSERLHQPTPSLSTSPDDSRNFRRGNSGLASSFGFKSPFSGTAASSPPSRKRPSPVENMLSNLAPAAVTWGNNTFLESVREKSSLGRSSFSEEDATVDYTAATPVTGVNMILYNQDSFDDEGCMNTSLLDFSHAKLFSNYRKSYSELLHMWNLRLSRLEILKFDGLPDHFKQGDLSPPISKSFAASVHSNNEKVSIQDIPPPSPIILGKKDQVVLDNYGLDITGYCLKHDKSRLEPLPFNTARCLGGAVGRCDRCDMTKYQLRCVICTEPASGEYIPCLSCGCVNHLHCIEEYHASGDTTCAGGCDCNCKLEAGMGVVESWAVMLGAIEQMRRQHQHGRRRGTDEWDAGEKGDWESARAESISNVSISNAGLANRYSTLSKRIGQVRSGEWGTGLKRKSSILKREEGQ